MNKNVITKVEISIGDKKILLTTEEAQKLFDSLKDLFDTKTIIIERVKTYPYPFNPWYWEQTPYTPWRITYGGGSGAYAGGNGGAIGGGAGSISTATYRSGTLSINCLGD